MSCGVSSRSTSRQHALRNSTVVTPVAMPGLSDGYLNLLPAENLSDHGHFEFERQGRAGHLFTCLDYSADDRQIDRCQQESRRIVDENVSAEFYALSPLGDHGHARLVSHRARSGRGGTPVERQPGNVRCPVLRGANEQGKLASQLLPQFACLIW